jgi:ATP-dependent RNA helicase DeaD
MNSPNLDPALAKALSDRGYATLTPVQQAVLEPQTQGRDLLVSAKTGSGKTVAYGLVLAETLLDANGKLSPPGEPQALVIAPTRELAIQVQRELQWLYADAKVVSCVGGMDPRAERRALDQGCQIVVGTPGRLRDHLERGQLRLDQLGAVILDEADEMLDLGFREELEEILDSTPKERRTLMFSATMPKPIIALASTYQTNALRMVVGGGETAHSDIDYRVIAISPNEVELATVNVLRYFESGAAIVFCSTRDAVRKLHANLVERGFNVVALSGELTQNERTHALQALRDRRARVCVATDVAARGIDIPDLDLVIHADLPTNRETLQHRSGRTGRAGRKGVCVILAPHPKRRRVDLLLRSANLQAKWEAAPTAEDIRAKDQLRLIEDVALASEATEDDMAVAKALMESRTPEDIAAAYVRLARTRMPAPEDLSSSEPEYRPYQGGGYERGGERGGERSGGRFEGQPEAPRPGFEDAVWYRIDLGRNKNAEARWLLPLICRRGHVTKRELGAIRVFERETRFQITAEAVERFELAMGKGEADGGRIERLEDNAPPPTRDRNTSSKRHRAGFEATESYDDGAAPAPPPRRPSYRDAPPRSEPRFNEAARTDAPRNDVPRSDAPRAEPFREPRPPRREYTDAPPKRDYSKDAPRDPRPPRREYADAPKRDFAEAPKPNKHPKSNAHGKPASAWDPLNDAPASTGSGERPPARAYERKAEKAFDGKPFKGKPFKGKPGFAPKGGPKPGGKSGPKPGPKR